MAELETRPDIDTINSSAELRRWYWLKSELAARAKLLGVKSTGAKFVILDRICHFYDSGEAVWPADLAPKPRSRFDWQKAPLTRNTVITDNYKNTQNVRQFFENNTSERFKFDIDLLDWLKTNIGSTLGDAVDYWDSQCDKKDRTTKIKPHNQFNQYCRDFFEHNPTKSMADARGVWALKRKRPSDDGRHKYESSDLLLEN